MSKEKAISVWMSEVLKRAETLESLLHVCGKFDLGPGRCIRRVQLYHGDAIPYPATRITYKLSKTHWHAFSYIFEPKLKLRPITVHNEFLSEDGERSLDGS